MSVVLGFSGSPVPNSNIDTVIREILGAASLSSEFIKLSRLNIRPCLGCLKCASSNRCVQKDDMNMLLDKICAARAVIIGGFPTYFSLNALTKTFLERWFPLKHRYMLTEGKFGIVAAGGFRDAGNVEEYLASFFKWFKMPLAGSILVPGNAPCLSCGKGEECSYSNVPINYGSAKIEPEMFRRAGQDTALLNKARELGIKLEKLINE